MLLAELVEVSTAVAAESSRLAKRAHIAGLLSRTPLEELEIATAYLAGAPRQRRTGVGWRGLSTLPPAAATPSVSLGEVDAALEHLGTLAGEGSATTRREEVTRLFERLTPPEQEYLTALITGNLRQGAQDALVLEAIAAAAEVPVTAVRRAAMFSGPTGPIAVAALSGGAASLERFDLEVGRPVRPMLAASAPDIAAGVEKLATEGEIVVDTKLDGIRIQVHKDGEAVTVFTRSLDEIADRLPHVVAVARSLPAETAILDGEALMVDADGRPRPFQETASSTATRTAVLDADAGAEADAEAAPAAAGERAPRPYFFDVLLVDGESLITRPLQDRLARLDALVPDDARIARTTTRDPDQAQAYFAEVVAAGHEGVVLKRLDAPYDAGRRGAAWIKVKPRHTLDLVVLAVEWGSGRRRGLLSNIHLGARAAEGDGFVMLGKTFKGMTDAMLAWQTERFLALETHREGHVVHLRPEQVVEIAFDGLQRSTRYPGGLALRFARVLRYRDDKSAAEADTLDMVRTLARS